MKQIDANTTEVIGKKAGKRTVTFRRVVSKDGKTLALTESGTNAKGEKVNGVAVYDKQQGIRGNAYAKITRCVEIETRQTPQKRPGASNASIRAQNRLSPRPSNFSGGHHA